MNILYDEQLLPRFDSVKDDNETILWIGKPKFVPYLLSGLGLGVGVLAFISLYYLFYRIAMLHPGGPDGFFSWIFIGYPLLIFLWSFANKLFSYRNTLYACTDKRVMIRTGFIGTDFKSIDYDKISDMEVTVNIIERICQVGSIRFYSGKTETARSGTRKLYDQWEAIPEPYKIFKMVKQVSVDIKTDYNYPNALRPAINPGYSTRYERM